MCKEKLFFIYNHTQADFFIKNGLTVIGSGYGSKGDAYVLFERNDKSELIFNAWKALSEAKKIIK